VCLDPVSPVVGLSITDVVFEVVVEGDGDGLGDGVGSGIGTGIGDGVRGVGGLFLGLCCGCLILMISSNSSFCFKVKQFLRQYSKKSPLSNTFFQSPFDSSSVTNLLTCPTSSLSSFLTTIYP